MKLPKHNKIIYNFNVHMSSMYLTISALTGNDMEYLEHTITQISKIAIPIIAIVILGVLLS